MPHAQAATPCPYAMEEPPTSSGRIFLGRAFEHLCALMHGYSGREIAEAFASMDCRWRPMVRMTARLAGEALARGEVHGWARPVGGGEPGPLRPSAWELDDFDRRLATCALDPRQPFDAEATPTHWIFVDVEDWNRLTEILVEPPARPAAQARSARQAPAIGQAAHVADDRAERRPERHLRLPEVKHRTGLSRSTIYRRMGEGRFPATLQSDDSMAKWSEREIDEWLEDRT